MAITKLTVQNFKSFGRVEIDLRNFNIVVGANASGKSNLVEVFEFLKDIVSYGLEDAISVHGGPKALRNFNSDNGNTLDIRLETNDVSRRMFGSSDDKIFGIKTERTTYHFGIRLNKRGSGFTIQRDEFSQAFTIVELQPEDAAPEAPFWMPGVTGRMAGTPGPYKEIRTLGPGSITLRNHKNWLDSEVALPEGSPGDTRFTSLMESLKGFPVPHKSLLLESPFISLIDLSFGIGLEDIRLYDFDPKKPKHAVTITGTKNLDGDAGNLAIVLQPVLGGNSPQKRDFVNIVSDLLPFVAGVGIDTLAYNALLTRLTERRSGKSNDVPASWASDGTILVLALVTALFFQDSKLAIFEEPERNIHPYLIGRVVQMMKEASETKQILVTTHNPEMMRHAELADILLVSRGVDGCSTISRPADSEVVRTFLENDLGVQDLFAQNLLGV